jgi:hypothetical protein
MSVYGSPPKAIGMERSEQSLELEALFEDLCLVSPSTPTVDERKSTPDDALVLIAASGAATNLSMRQLSRVGRVGEPLCMPDLLDTLRREVEALAGSSKIEILDTPYCCLWK